MPLTSLPPDYQEAYALRVTQGRRLLWLNVIALAVVPLWMVVWGGLLTGYHALGAPLVITTLPQDIPDGLGWGLVLLVLPLHEWVHGLAIRRAGHRPRYGIKPLKGVLYATADGAFFWRNQYIGMALAPLVVISAACALLMAVLPFGLAYWAAVAGILNATGAIADIWMAWIARRYMPDAIFQDEADGMRVFTCAGASPQQALQEGQRSL